jgi:NTE family protein
MDNKKNLKVGLALSGGGGRGYAHIGVIKVLEKNNIPIDFIAGSSAGALFGALYSFLKDIQKLEKISLDNDFRKFLNFVIDPSSKGGLIKGDKIRKYIAEIINDANFDDLKIPFKAVATDFDTAEAVVLSKGDVSLAVQASTSFPFIFKPVMWGDKTLWDGGMSNPLPADIVREMGADIVIGVNLYNQTMFENKNKSKENAYWIFVKSLGALQYSLAKECLKSADVVINPSVENFGLIGLDSFIQGKGKDFILKGEEATESVLPMIKEFIKGTTEKD